MQGRPSSGMASLEPSEPPQWGCLLRKTRTQEAISPENGSGQEGTNCFSARCPLVLSGDAGWGRPSSCPGPASTPAQALPRAPLWDLSQTCTATVSATCLQLQQARGSTRGTYQEKL